MTAFDQGWLDRHLTRRVAASAQPPPRRKPKKPRASRIEPSELQVHIGVAGHLRHRGAPGLWWFHPANGELRDERTAAKLKAMGVKAGAPDLVMLHRGRLYALELKRQDGRLSPEQHAARAEIEAAGGFWACAHGVDAALAILIAWGIIGHDHTTTDVKGLAA